MLPADVRLSPSVMLRLPPVAVMLTEAALMLPARLRLAVVASSVSAPPMLQSVLEVPRPTVLRLPSESSASTTDSVAAPVAVTVLMVVASSLSALPAAPSVVPERMMVAAVTLAPLTPSTPVMVVPLMLAMAPAETCDSASAPVEAMVRLPAAVRLALEAMLMPTAPKSSDRSPEEARLPVKLLVPPPTEMVTLPAAALTSLSLPATTSMMPASAAKLLPASAQSLTLRLPVFASSETSPAVTMLRSSVVRPARMLPLMLFTLTEPLLVRRRPSVMSPSAVTVIYPSSPAPVAVAVWPFMLR